MVSIDLINSCIARDKIAQRQLYEACAPYVYTIIKNYIGDESYRKDAMQEAFSHIFSSLENYDPERGQFKSWIGRITANRCATLLKRTINFSMRLEESITPDLGEHTFAYLDQLSKVEIEQLLVNMPKGYRTIFLLSVIEEYSHKEISELLDITPDTSRSQLFRAIKWIKKNIFPNTKDIVYGTL